MTVEMILRKLAEGEAELPEDYPRLKPGDIRAAITFRAALSVSEMHGPRTLPERQHGHCDRCPSIAKRGPRACRKHSKCSFETTGSEVVFAVLYSWPTMLL